MKAEGCTLRLVEEVNHLFRSKATTRSNYRTDYLSQWELVAVKRQTPFANGKSDRHDEVKRLMGAVSREKKFAKPLDKPLQVCYTIITKRKENLPNQKGLIPWLTRR